MGKTAIVLVATGLTGNFLLEKLITDSSYKKIKLFSRNSVHKTSTKIEEHLIDLFKLDTCKELFTGDVLFCCIGTTASKTKDKEVYKAIDYGIPVSAAKLATINNIKTFVVLSSMGANPSSSIFYNKTKGEMERDVLRQNIKNTYVLRPSLIGGNRDEVRVGERIGKVVMSLLGPFFLGPLKKYKIISPENIVSCMQKLAESEVYQSIFSSDEIVKIANSNKNK